jgi:hypothetical protein
VGWVMLNLSKRDCFVEIINITIFFISLISLFFFDGGYYSNLTLKLICVYSLGASLLSHIIHLFCKKAYKLIDRYLSKLLRSIFSYTSSFSELLGYQLMLGFLKRFPSFIVAGIFFFIFVAGYYYQQHFRSVLGIDKNIFQGSFSDNFYAINGIFTLLLPSIKWLTVLSFTCLILLVFTVMFLVPGAALVKYSNQSEDRLFTKCLGQLLSLAALIPFTWFSVMIFITPLGIAESNSRDDAEEAIFGLLERNVDAKLFFTDQNYNYVIYPKEKVFCRTLINEPFLSLKEIANKKLLDYKCFEIGDATFRKDFFKKITEKQEKSRLNSLMGEKTYQELVNNYS